ncbi:MAG: arginine--tRNA ligase, partial [Pseudomonadota bacterium]|nr:arginine--tRNA ligase [Pseudomonadota bacterium]
MKDAVAGLFEQALDQLIAQGIIDATDRKPVQIENTRDPAHGDLATNLAMMHAKAAKMAPRALAELVLEQLPQSDSVRSTEIAGPGFINVRLAKEAAFEPVIRCLKEHHQFGFHQATNERVQVEFVSANPTGPLHVGHGRGAAYGATLVNLLKARGHQVEAEYYVNDAGRQVNILAVSVFIRYLEHAGESFVFPSAGYQGDYIFSLGATLFQNVGNLLQISVDALLAGVPPDSEETKDAHIDGLIQNAKESLGDDWLKPFDLALTAILDDIKDDLSEFGANFDAWFSEKSLVKSGEIDQAIATLEERGYLYEQDGAIWFRSTAFGDDKDRVIRRDNGETTYFASD